MAIVLPGRPALSRARAERPRYCYEPGSSVRLAEVSAPIIVVAEASDGGERGSIPGLYSSLYSSLGGVGSYNLPDPAGTLEAIRDKLGPAGTLEAIGDRLDPAGT